MMHAATAGKAIKHIRNIKHECISVPIKIAVYQSDIVS